MNISLKSPFVVRNLDQRNREKGPAHAHHSHVDVRDPWHLMMKKIEKREREWLWICLHSWRDMITTFKLHLYVNVLFFQRLYFLPPIFWRIHSQVKEQKNVFVQKRRTIKYKKSSTYHVTVRWICFLRSLSPPLSQSLNDRELCWSIKCTHLITVDWIIIVCNQNEPFVCISCSNPISLVTNNNRSKQY